MATRSKRKKKYLGVYIPGNWSFMSEKDKPILRVCNRCGAFDIDDAHECKPTPTNEVLANNKISSSNNSISVDRVEAIAANAETIRNMILPGECNDGPEHCRVCPPDFSGVRPSHGEPAPAVCICAEINARHCPVHSADVTAQPLKDNIAKEDVMAAGFDHPCKQTCSGWQQGFERGQFELRQRLAEVEAELAEVKAEHQHWFDTDYAQSLKRRNELKAALKRIAYETLREFAWVEIAKEALEEVKS